MAPPASSRDEQIQSPLDMHERTHRMTPWCGEIRACCCGRPFRPAGVLHQMSLQGRYRYRRTLIFRYRVIHPIVMPARMPPAAPDVVTMPTRIFNPRLHQYTHTNVCLQLHPGGVHMRVPRKRGAGRHSPEPTVRFTNGAGGSRIAPAPCPSRDSDLGGEAPPVPPAPPREPGGKAGAR